MIGAVSSRIKSRTRNAPAPAAVSLCSSISPIARRPAISPLPASILALASLTAASSSPFLELIRSWLASMVRPLATRRFASSSSLFLKSSSLFSESGPQPGVPLVRGPRTPSASASRVSLRPFLCTSLSLTSCRSCLFRSSRSSISVNSRFFIFSMSASFLLFSSSRYASTSLWNSFSSMGFVMTTEMRMASANRGSAPMMPVALNTSHQEADAPTSRFFRVETMYRSRLKMTAPHSSPKPTASTGRPSVLAVTT